MSDGTTHGGGSGGQRYLRKRSFTLAGHRTSIALEPEFWAVLEAAAARRGVSLSGLVAMLDARRTEAAADAAAGGAPLASALRVFALREAAAARG